MVLGEHTRVTVQTLEAVGDQEPVETEGLPVEPLGHVVVTDCDCVNVVEYDVV